jgi:ankyrin repeat protein
MNNFNEDAFQSKILHINTLFQFLKSGKDEQFIGYINSLEKGEIDINMKDENGNYLIFFAVMMNNKIILKKILEYNPKIDIFDNEGYNLLYYPIKFLYYEIIDILLNFNKKNIGISLVNLKDLKGCISIFYAIKFKNKYAIQELLINGVDVNYKNNNNFNSLHLATLKKDINIVKSIIVYINNINEKSVTGSTSLHYACNFQLGDIVRILIENGADQTIIEDEYDFYPIFYSVIQNNVKITNYLIMNHVDANHQDYIGNTIVHYAILNNQLEMLDFIFDNYAIKKKYDDDAILVNENINSTAESSGKSSKSKIIEINPNIMNIEGLTIFHLFCYNYTESYDKFIKLILPYSNLNNQDNIGNTILYLLIEKNIWKKFFDQLIFKKINIYIKNNKNITPFDIVHLEDRELFIKLVIASIKSYIGKHVTLWQIEWQNNISKYNKKELDTLIRSFIIDEKKSIPVRHNKFSIDIKTYENINFTTFTGGLIDVIAGFKYLTKKYSFARTLLFSDNNNNNYNMITNENPKQYILDIEIRWIYQKIYFPKNFDNKFELLMSDTKCKFIIIPIGIILSNGNHSNCLIFDIDNNIIERFEPHGSSYPSQFNYNPDYLDNILFNKFDKLLGTILKNKYQQVKYLLPKNYLPKIGFQKFENVEKNKNIGDPLGFCTLWCIWYIDYKLEYRERSSFKIVRSLIKGIKKNNLSFRSLIRNYSTNVTDIRDSYLSKIDKNINDYLNNKLTESDIVSLVNIIISD